MAKDPDTALVPVFKNIPLKHGAKSLEAGRPIYEDVEHVELRASGTRNYGVYPATEFSHWEVNPETGEQTKVTYAERFSRQYRQFKEKQQQTKVGTPLDHAPFLTDARRAELRAQNIYIVEQLAEIDGQELKNLGVGGRDMKNRAIEWLADAKSSAPNLQLQAELEALRARNQILEEDVANMKQRATATEAQFADMSDEAIRQFIQTHTGHAPQGDLPRKMLVRMATDVRPNKAA